MFSDNFIFLANVVGDNVLFSAIQKEMSLMLFHPYFGLVPTYNWTNS